ncbi:HIT domain-containing protein [Patescibacteria group bacterium]|nr:HIT domain-containing protein [Patescibacteria group bacterium]
MDCIFCKIITKQIQSDIVFENKNIIIFKDINPSAPIHFLIVPKEHIKSLATAKEEHKQLILEMIWQAKLLSAKLELAKDEYQLLLNCGQSAGQIVGHIHLHFKAGWNQLNK